MSLFFTPYSFTSSAVKPIRRDEIQYAAPGKSRRSGVFLLSGGLARGCFAAGGGGGHFAESIVNCERCCLLTRWEVLERLEELADHGLRRHDHVALAHVPVPVGIRRDVSALEWIGPQVVELGDPQYGEWFCPELQGSLAALFHENHLPIIEAHGDQVAIIVKVD